MQVKRQFRPLTRKPEPKEHRKAASLGKKGGGGDDYF